MNFLKISSIVFAFCGHLRVGSASAGKLLRRHAQGSVRICSSRFGGDGNAQGPCSPSSPPTGKGNVSGNGNEE